MERIMDKSCVGRIKLVVSLIFLFLFILLCALLMVFFFNFFIPALQIKYDINGTLSAEHHSLTKILDERPKKEFSQIVEEELLGGDNRKNEFSAENKSMSEFSRDEDGNLVPKGTMKFWHALYKILR